MTCSTLTRTLRTLAVLLLGLAVTVPADAQFGNTRPIQIEDVRVGFPAGALDLYKVGKWVPVLVTIGPPKELGGVLPAEFRGRIEIESRDGDGWVTHLAKNNVTLTKDNPRGVFQAYTKISESGFQSVTVRLVGQLGTTDINLTYGYPSQAQGRVTGSRSDVEHDELLVVNIGSSAGLTAEEGDQSTRTTSSGQQIQQIRRAASPNRLFELPDRWFGYESVDAVVLTTGGTFNNSLVQHLARDPVKRDALEQWVLQGGHLIVSVGSNASMVASAADFPLEPLLPVKIDRAGPNREERLDGLRDFIHTLPSNIRKSEGEIRGPSAPFARLEPKPGASTFTAALVSDYTKRPLIVRAPYGLGKVTVVGFDTNSEAFQSWSNKFDFWGAVFEARTVTTGQYNYNYNYGRQDASLELANRIEEFGDVPVISFAVVAFFIAVYIILIGPVDYFVLKKVFKRLEYTWFTFPTVVLVVSLAAYFGAYYLKGDKLRINKVDVVELDLTHGRAAGEAWLAVFSPRLLNYNVDLTPQGVTPPTGTPAVTMSWLGRFGSGARTLGQAQGGLFERSYEYTPEADGIRNLPIQVWSQKSLEARWVANLDRNQVPLEHELSKGKIGLQGRIKSKLPKPLKGAKLFFQDKSWTIGTLEPDKAVNLDSLESRTGFAQYLENQLPAKLQGQQPDFSNDLNKLMFATRSGEGSGRETTNDYLRYLNQSWRLKDYGEAILIGTYVDDYGDAGSLNQGGTFGTKLKLTGASGNDLLTGSMRQCTILRIYIPIKESAQ
jgi:hypothetical protein